MDTEIQKLLEEVDSNLRRDLDEAKAQQDLYDAMIQYENVFKVKIGFLKVKLPGGGTDIG